MSIQRQVRRRLAEQKYLQKKQPQIEQFPNIGTTIGTTIETFVKSNNVGAEADLTFDGNVRWKYQRYKKSYVPYMLAGYNSSQEGPQFKSGVY